MANDRNAYTTKYKKEHYKRVPFEMKKEFYEEVLAPAASLRGLSVTAYIREAVEEKIEREKDLYAK